MQAPGRTDLTRTLLLILITTGLIVGSIWTLLPFLSALAWATTIVVATWPLMRSVERRTGGRRAVATTVMTLVILAIFIVPFSLAVAVLLQASIEGLEIVRAMTRDGLPSPPAWLGALPWVGTRLTAEWQALAAGGPEAIAEALRPFVRSGASWALQMTGGFGLIAVHFLLTVILAAALYANGEGVTAGVRMFARRLGKERGERTLVLAGQALRGVALGVVVTALVQTVIAGVGLWLAGVPRVGLLVAVILVLCIAQLGPLPVLLPVVIWLFWSGSVGWGIVLTAITVVVAVADNVLKPVLIRRGVDLPLPLIIGGVIGGLLSFGVVGLFLGPILLAVTYTLFDAWVRDGDQPAGDQAL
jgi:predicted PurR-regulated permease PerM